jgi:hypothetical protein
MITPQLRDVCPRCSQEPYSLYPEPRRERSAEIYDLTAAVPAAVNFKINHAVKARHDNIVGNSAPDRPSEQRQRQDRHQRLNFPGVRGNDDQNDGRDPVEDREARFIDLH